MTYKAPDPGVPLYHTVVHTGTKAADGFAGGDAAVFDAIWSKFEGKSIPKVNIERTVRLLEGDALLYYGPQSYTRSDEIETSINGLLAYGYGRCGAWAQFSKSVFGTQGIVSPKTRQLQAKAEGIPRGYGHAGGLDRRRGS